MKSDPETRRGVPKGASHPGSSHTRYPSKTDLGGGGARAACETCWAMQAGLVILRKKDLARILGVCLRTVETYVKQGRLPKPRYLSGPVWRLDELEALLNRLPKTRNAERGMRKGRP